MKILNLINPTNLKFGQKSGLPGIQNLVVRRPAEDMAFTVARFIQNSGSFFNYYMYHGGTNFGRTTAGRFIATSYDYDAPLDEYGLLNEPKYGHMRDLHKAIKLLNQPWFHPMQKSLGSEKIKRLTCIAQNLAFVQHFCPTLTQLFQLKSLYRICNMTCLHGPSAFFLIAELLSTTLLGLAPKALR